MNASLKGIIIRVIGCEKSMGRKNFDTHRCVFSLMPKKTYISGNGRNKDNEITVLLLTYVNATGIKQQYNNTKIVKSVINVQKELFFKEILGVQTPEKIKKLCNISYFLEVPKGTLVARNGEIQTEALFLDEGIFRGYFLDVSGKEVTDCIGWKTGDSAMAAHNLGGSAWINIEMMTDGRLLAIPIEYLLNTLQKDIELLQIYNRLLIHSLSFHWNMKVILYQYTAMERYQWFLKNYPGLIDRISNKCIASFLGMTPVTLSRLRKAIRSEQRLDTNDQIITG